MHGYVVMAERQNRHFTRSSHKHVTCHVKYVITYSVILCYYYFFKMLFYAIIVIKQYDIVYKTLVP